MSRKQKTQQESSKGRSPTSKITGEKKANISAVEKLDDPPRATRKKKKIPHPLESLLGEHVVDAQGNFVTPETLLKENGNGVLGLYFAAHWCPPCRTFCPNLMLLYDELKKRHNPFEVIYISLDNKEPSFNEYLSKMPWYAVPFTEEDKREEIAITFGIKGIPFFVLLDIQTLEVIAHNGREVVSKDPRGALYPWKNLPEEMTRASTTSSKALSSSSRATSTKREQDRRQSMSSDRSKKKKSYDNT
ncbi:hypothetical protein RRG08_030873 [Elysia crispata]|uniref:Thioredoxin domain-containing protein n=1 Tax=Elysia crispata TaxID=231223 RepID=A0AAE1CLG7_9GAST|nr:hypothetical protein RRG08_030873 [Elysia crispata]